MVNLSRTRAVIALAATAIALSACGGDDSGSSTAATGASAPGTAASTTATTPSEQPVGFVGRVDAVCAEVNDQVSAIQQEPRDPSTFAPAALRWVEIAGDAHEQLQAIEPPAAAVADYRRFVVLLDAQARAMRAMARWGGQTTIERFPLARARYDRADAQFRRAQKQRAAVARRLRLKVCGAG